MAILSEEELSKIPQDYRPDGPVERTVVRQLELPCLSSIKNRVEVVFDGAEPVIEG